MAHLLIYIISSSSTNLESLFTSILDITAHKFLKINWNRSRCFL